MFMPITTFLEELRKRARPGDFYVNSEGAIRHVLTDECPLCYLYARLFPPEMGRFENHEYDRAAAALGIDLETANDIATESDEADLRNSFIRKRLIRILCA